MQNGISNRNRIPPGFSNENGSVMAEMGKHRLSKMEDSWRDSTPSRFIKGQVAPEVQKQLKTLPIYDVKHDLIKAVRENQIVIVVGEAGSGKSTQIPTYLAEAGFADSGGLIGCTQPRRLAAKSLAERVSQECGTELGTMVGYAVRFERSISPETVIKFMTDGLLVREFAINPKLSDYSVLIIDEAHERSKYTDVCFGLIKRLLQENTKLRVIITSATLDETQFSKYFNDAPIFNVTGKMFPVMEEHDAAQKWGMTNYLDGAVEMVCKIHVNEKPGDILVFLPGQGDIEKAEEMIRIRLTGRSSGFQIVPCYGLLSLERQNLIFNPAPHGYRKIAIATNIAETSLTIPGIVYVVDSGVFKQSEYDPLTGIENLVTKRITKAQATQRKGRAGRTCNGKIFRLYSETDLAGFSSVGIPEIQRSSLESVVLQLIAMGFNDVFKFDFMAQPSKAAVCEALEKLLELSAVNANMILTDLGKLMAEFPLDPTQAKVLITSVKFGCSQEILKIVASLSPQNQNLFIEDKSNRDGVNAAKKKFGHADGDQLTFLNVHEAWRRNGLDMQWCSQNHLSHQYLEEVDNVIKQLEELMSRNNLHVTSCGRETTSIRKSLCSGYFRNLAVRKEFRGFGYKMITASNSNNFRSELFIHPSSTIFRVKPCPQMVLYKEVFKTSKYYMNGLISVEKEWLRELVPNYYIKLKTMHPNMF